MLDELGSDLLAEWGRLAMTRDYITDRGPGNIPAEPPVLTLAPERIHALFDFIDSHSEALYQHMKDYLVTFSYLISKPRPDLQEDSSFKACTDAFEKAVQSLPAIFFDESFKVQDAIKECSSSHHLTAEFLQRNLDQIEMCLLKHIQNRTKSFFSTMDTLRDLYVETDKMIKIVLFSRRKIRHLRRKAVAPHFQMVLCKRRQTRLQSCRTKVSVVLDIRRIFESADSSRENGNFEDSLNLLRRTKTMMNEEQLERLYCGQALVDHQVALEKKLSNSLEAECGKIFHQNDLEHFSVEYTRSLLASWLQLENCAESLVSEIFNSVQNASKSITLGLIDKSVNGIETGRVNVQLTSPSDSNPESTSIHALCSLSEPRFTDFLVCLYASLDRLSENVYQMCNIVDTFDRLDAVVTLSQQLKDAFRSANESTHGRIARVINIRKRAESDVSLATVCVRVQAGLEFVCKDEQRCSTSFLAIRQLLVQQARQCLSQHQALFIKQTVNALDDENWKPVDPNRSFQKMIDRTFSMLINDPPPSRQVRDTETWTVSDWNDNDSSSSGDDRPSSPSKLTHLVVDTQRFRVTRSLLELLSNIQETLMIANMLPKEISPSDLVSLHICTLLRNYNSRSKQLILGTAATTLPDSKVKQINAKMLCLLSQNIGLLIAVVPLLRAAISDLFEVKSRLEAQLVQLVQIEKDLDDHRQNIFTKIISIMDKVTSAIQDQIVQTGVENNLNLERTLSDLMKQTRLLHRFVSSILPHRQVNQIFTAISKHIGDAVASSLIQAGMPKNQRFKMMIDIKQQFINMKIRVDHVPSFSDPDNCDNISNGNLQFGALNTDSR